MFRKILGFLAVLSCALMGMASTQAATIRFENVAAVGDIQNAANYTEAGYTFKAVPFYAAIFDPLAATFVGDNTAFFGFAGTDYQYGPALVTLSGTAPFNLNSLLVGGITYAGGSGTSTVTIVGNFVGGSSQSVVYQNLSGATLKTLNWTNLVNVQFSASSTTALDDINVTAVPEPETYALLLAGLGVMGLLARRRKTTLR